jgi:hypothetical protein
MNWKKNLEEEKESKPANLQDDIAENPNDKTVFI